MHRQYQNNRLNETNECHKLDGIQVIEIRKRGVTKLGKSELRRFPSELY